MIHDLRTAQFVIIGLAILLIAAIFMIIKLSRKGMPSKQDLDGSHGSVSREKFNLVFNQRNEASQEKERFENLYNDYREKYEGACVEIGKLKRKIDDLTRDNNELNVLYNNDSSLNSLDEKIEASIPVVMLSQESEIKTGNKEDIVIRYASFPRAADSAIYFSDITDKLADDSYFELRISNETGKASFRPLDFMKIRNYDPAMAAILTEGVKPNMASSVVGVEMGEAHLEGNDWVIKSLAKVKLI